MYLSYYNLDKEPFSISTDPKFLWLGEKHKEALAVLKYGILANKGFLILTGDVGTGKTTLINTLLNELPRGVVVATVHDPGLQPLEFFNFIAGAFKFKKTFKSKREFLYYFAYFLKLAHNKNKKVLLIIDEAQRLSSDLLEEIRLLSNIERQDTKLINIFFVGQNEFREILLENQNRALRQRITMIHSLEALSEKETRAYIEYRLQIAGRKDNIFDSGSFKEIYAFSGGYPRLINIICDHALLTGFVKEKKTIDARTIKECARELRVPLKSNATDNKRQPYAAAGQTGWGLAGKSTAWRKVGYVFLVTLLIVLAAAFYYLP